MLVYVDTSALIALAMSTDKYHGPATEYFRGALEDGTRFITGRPVLIEYIDGVAKRIGKSEAIEELRLLESTATLRIEPDTEDDWELGRQLFLRYDDQGLWLLADKGQRARPVGGLQHGLVGPAQGLAN